MAFEPDEEILETAIELVASDVTYPAKKLREGYDISEMYSRFYANGAKCVLAEAGEEVAADAYLKNRVDALEKENRELEKQSQLGEALSTAIQTAVEQLPPLDWESPRPRHSHGQEAFCVCIGDWHVGEEITLEETNGLGEFNFEILERRLENFKQGILNHLDAKSTVYKTCYVFGIGDFIDNTCIYGGQRAKLEEQSAFQQTLRAMDLLTGFLCWLREHFDRVVFHGVPGNHGEIRTGRSKSDTPISDNWDYIMYRWLDERLADYDSIEIYAQPSWFDIFKIKGWEFHLSHGDDVRCYRGISFYGMLRKKKGVIEQTHRHPDYFISGHFHQDGISVIDRMVVNGCMPGTNKYSGKKLRTSSLPTQTVFSVHEDWGITWMSSVKLEPPGKYHIDEVTEHG